VAPLWERITDPIGPDHEVLARSDEQDQEDEEMRGHIREGEFSSSSSLRSLDASCPGQPTGTRLGENVPAER
jgi:hypothetical protein